MTLRADDRVLLLDIPSDAELAAIARILIQGVLVVLGEREGVDRARAHLAEFENVMLIESRPDQIPWRDDYFTKIIVPPHLQALMRSSAAEFDRVLAPGGQILSPSADS